MEQLDCITKGKNYKHFTERERYKLEGYLESKLNIKEINKRLNKHQATIYREIKRGTVVRLSSELIDYSIYRANVAQRDYDNKVTRRKRLLKISKNKDLEEHIRKKILKDKLSPDAVIG